MATIREVGVNALQPSNADAPTGRSPVHDSRLDLRDVLRDAAADVRNTVEGRGQELTVAIEPLLHGGSIEARSDGAWKGSEFIVRLPFAERRA
jgi:hypothetical protein